MLLADQLPPITIYPICEFGIAYVGYIPDDDEKILNVTSDTTDPRGQLFIPSWELWMKMLSSGMTPYEVQIAYLKELEERSIDEQLLRRIVSLPRITFIGERLDKTTRNYLFFIHKYLRNVAIKNEVTLNYVGLVKSRRKR